MTQPTQIAVKKKKNKLTTFDYFVVAALTVLVVIIAVPVYLSLVTSVIPEHSYISQPVQFIPQKVTLQNYAYIIENLNLFTCYGNSILNTLLCMSYGMLCTITMGYGFSFKSFPGRKLLFVILVFTMFFGGGILPDYMLARDLGLINTRWACVLWGGVNVMNVIITRNNIENIPSELKEAAYIDGAGEFATFFRVVLPLLKPLLATFSLFFSVAAWNDYFWPMLMLQSNDLRTLPLMLRNLITNDMMDTTRFNSSIAEEMRAFSQGIKMAGVVMTMLPIMCIYPFLQKHFAKGMLLGSLKG